MRYGKRPDPTPEEIEAIIKAIQAGWSAEDHRRRARGRHDDAANCILTWEVPVVAVSPPDGNLR